MIKLLSSLIALQHHPRQSGKHGERRKEKKERKGERKGSKCEMKIEQMIRQDKNVLCIHIAFISS